MVILEGLVGMPVEAPVGGLGKPLPALGVPTIVPKLGKPLLP